MAIDSKTFANRAPTQTVMLDKTAMDLLVSIDKSLTEISKMLRGAYQTNADLPVGVLRVQVTNFDEAPR